MAAHFRVQHSHLLKVIMFLLLKDFFPQWEIAAHALVFHSWTNWSWFMTEEEALQAKLMPCGCHQLSIWEGNSNIWSELLLWRARTTTLQDEQQAIQRSCTWPTALPVHLQRPAGRWRGPEWWQRRKGCLRWSEVIQIFNCWQIPSAGCASNSVTGGSKWQRFLFFPRLKLNKGAAASDDASSKLGLEERLQRIDFLTEILMSTILWCVSRVSWAALGMSIRMCFLGADVYHCHVAKAIPCTHVHLYGYTITLAIYRMKWHILAILVHLKCFLQNFRVPIQSSLEIQQSETQNINSELTNIPFTFQKRISQLVSENWEPGFCARSMWYHNNQILVRTARVKYTGRRIKESRLIYL